MPSLATATTPKGYTNQSVVRAHLGIADAFDETQSEFEQWLENFAEQYIDSNTNSSWLTPPITDEQYSLAQNQTLWLRWSPVDSIQRVRRRPVSVGQPWTTLTSGTDYELIRPQSGELLLQSAGGLPYYGHLTGPREMGIGLQMYGGAVMPQLISVDYTPNRPVPYDVSQAATLIVAHSMLLNMFSGRLGITVAQIDMESRIEYDDGAIMAGVPPLADKIISSLGREVLFK